MSEADAPWNVRRLTAPGDAEIEQLTDILSVGDIPRFALFPAGDFCSTTYYYRSLD